jgi:tRNA (guanine37-N1)-methyltransferase
MDIHVITIFPEMFAPILELGIIGRAHRAGLVEVHVHALRDYTHDHHKSVDDSPFGGGPGMVMRPEPLFEALDTIRPVAGTPVLVMTPQGKPYTQRDAERLSGSGSLVIICGRYEGIDERARSMLGTEEVSVGDYVLTGGEIPAMTVTDSVIRLLPGAVGHGEEAVSDDSHTSGILQYPQYTRPAEYRGMSVPDVLLSGDHAAVDIWRRKEALRRTLERRPDLLGKANLTKRDRATLDELKGEL